MKKTLKVLVLSTTSPGIRYTAHINQLINSGCEVEIVIFDGYQTLISRILFQWNLLWKKGFKKYRSYRERINQTTDIILNVNSLDHQSILKKGFQETCLCPSFKSFNGYNKAFFNFVRDFEPDFLLQAGAGIIPAKVIRKVGPILNIHPGILPGIRGISPNFWAYYYGKDDWLGTTLHYIDTGIDTGKPIIRRKVQKIAREHFSNIMGDLVVQECFALEKFITHFEDGNYRQFDQGGEGTSRYRSYFSVKQYQDLKDNNWEPIKQLP